MNKTYPQMPVNSQQEVERFFSMFEQRDPEVKWCLTLATLKSGRSGKQNRLSHMLYAEVEKQGGEYTALQAKNISKYYCGVPIIYADDEHYGPLVAKTLRPLSVEDRIDCMSLISLTSILKVSQMAQYLDRMYRLWEEDDNIRLPRPDDLYYDSLGVKKGG